MASSSPGVAIVMPAAEQFRLFPHDHFDSISPPVKELDDRRRAGMNIDQDLPETP